MGSNGADWAVWESAGVCLGFFCSCRFDVSVDVGFLRNIANALFYFLTSPSSLPSSFSLFPNLSVIDLCPLFKVTVFTTVLWIIKKSSSLRWRDDTIKKVACGRRGGHVANLRDTTTAPLICQTDSGQLRKEKRAFAAKCQASGASHPSGGLN